MNFGWFCLLSMIVGDIGLALSAVLEYAFNNVRAKVFFSKVKCVCAAFGLFGLVMVVFAAFGR